MVNSTVPPIWHIYKVTCASTDKSYVGLTKCGVNKRWRHHVWRSHSDRPREERFLLHRAIKKYGPDAFAVEVLSTHPSLKFASDAERRAIHFHGTLSPAGYNFTEGGMGTPGFRKPHSEETRRKISAGNKGKTVSAAARKRMGLAKRGKPLSPQHTAKLSAVRKTARKPSAYYSALSKLKTGRAVPLKALRFILRSLQRIEDGTCRNYRAEHGKWSTRICIGNAKKHLGMFPTKEAAIAAYKNALQLRLIEVRSVVGDRHLVSR